MSYYKQVYHLKEEDRIRIDSIIAAFQMALSDIFEQRAVDDSDPAMDLAEFDRIAAKIRDEDLF